jgi:hypothetical protein
VFPCGNQPVIRKLLTVYVDAGELLNRIEPLPSPLPSPRPGLPILQKGKGISLWLWGDSQDREYHSSTERAVQRHAENVLQLVPCNSLADVAKTVMLSLDNFGIGAAEPRRPSGAVRAAALETATLFANYVARLVSIAFFVDCYLVLALLSFPYAFLGL